MAPCPFGLSGKSADDKTSESLAALLLDSAPNPLAVRLEAGNQKEEKKGVFRVPIMVKIPIPLLALLPQQGMHVAQLSLFIVTQDDRGRTSAVQKREIPIRIPSAKLEAARSQVAAFPIMLALRPGAQRVAVGVRDDYASARSAVSLNVWVGRGEVLRGTSRTKHRFLNTDSKICISAAQGMIPERWRNLRASQVTTLGCYI